MPMDLRATATRVARVLAASAAAAATTLVLTRLNANSAEAGMVFLALVVWSATQAGPWLSLYVTAVCALAFDFFFLPPFRSLRIIGAQGWVALASFLVCSVIVSRLAARARRQTLEAEQRQQDVERLYELSQEMMLHEDAASLIHDLPRLIQRIFVMDTVILYVCEHDQFYRSTGEVPQGVQTMLRAMTQGQNPTGPVDSEFYMNALMLGMRPVGAVAWQPASFSHEVASAVSAQVAIVLARSMAIEASARTDAAREAERLRTALVDSLTHELRTPLTSIRAAASTLLEAKGLDEAGRIDLITIVDEEASRLDLLIGEAVEMAEIDADVVQVQRVPQHVRALLDHAVEESRRALARFKVDIEVQGDDKPAWFDPHLLARVLRHLLENAARFTPPGGCIFLRSWRSSFGLEFSVEDTGQGIDPHDLPMIFEKFYRGRSAAHKSKGSGMGLAITRAILIAHGGGIKVASTPGKGAKLHFWIPLIERQPVATPLVSRAAAPQAPTKPLVREKTKRSSPKQPKPAPNSGK
jgi:two-component system sensor histidine kinase KdpD